MFYPQSSGIPHVQANFQRDAACTCLQALVAVARSQHLPAEAFARAADPHAT
ncbi:MAG: hypothetical protein ABSG96_04165 [Terracidiphilus sp.]